MRFLLKCIFWLGGVFLIMPGLLNKQGSTPPHPTAQSQTSIPASDNQAPSSPDLIDQWLQAGKSLQEITSFCERNPALCASGALAAQKLGEQQLTRAREAFHNLTTPPATPPVTNQQHPQQNNSVKIPIPSQRPH